MAWCWCNATESKPQNVSNNESKLPKKSIMELKITFVKQLKMLSALFFVTFVFVCFAIYSKFYLSSTALSVFFGIYLMFYLLPVMFIHNNYLHKYRNKIYKVSNNEISKIEMHNQVTYYFKDIEEITIYAPANLKSTFRTFAFEDYHFSEIKFKNGEIWNINSLFCSNLIDFISKHFDPEIIKIEKTFYPYIKNHYC